MEPYKYANGGGNITECFALPRKPQYSILPCSLPLSRQQVILLSSFLSPLPHPANSGDNQSSNVQRPTS